MLRRQILAAGAALPIPRIAAAQSTPTRFIVPYGPGNITDQVARVLSEALTQRLGWRLTVDNQPGAGGVLGTLNLIRAPADGSTFAMISVAALAIVPHITRPPRYDPLTDLTPISGVSVSSAFLAVNAAVPAHSLEELVAVARGRPADAPLFYYSPGNATVPHLNLENLRRRLDFPMQHVPYRTSGAGNSDLLANRVQVTMDSMAVTLPHLQSGALRALAYNGAQRHPDFPSVPTFAEAAPEVQMLNAWQALFFPPGTPAPVVERVGRDIVATITEPAFAAKLPVGTQPFTLGPAELAAHMRRDHERLGRLAAEIGLQQD